MGRRLPRMNWRLLGPRIGSANTTNNIASIKQLIIQSGSHWRLVESPVTGTTSLLLQPVTASAQIYVVIATNITGALAYQSPDVNAQAFTASNIQVGLYVGSGTFLGPQRTYPFTGSVSNKWWGYWYGGNFQTTTQSYVIEGSEAIFIGSRSATNQYGSLLGVIGETDALSGEPAANSPIGGTGYRKIGVITTGNDPISSIFLSSQNGFFGHFDGSSHSHAGVWSSNVIGTGSTIHPMWMSGLSSPATSLYTIQSVSLIAAPIYMVSSASQFLCKIRDVYVAPNFRNLTNLISGSTTVGVFIGGAGNTATVANTVLFAPFSGAQDFNTY